MSRGRGHRGGGAVAAAPPRPATVAEIDPAHLTEAAQTLAASDEAVLANLRAAFRMVSDDPDSSLEERISQRATDIMFERCHPGDILFKVRQAVTNDLPRLRPAKRPLAALSGLAEFAINNLRGDQGVRDRDLAENHCETIRRVLSSPGPLHEGRDRAVRPLFNTAPPKQIDEFQTKITMDLLKGELASARSRIAAFWMEWGDPARAQACLESSEEDMEMMSRLCRARSIFGRQNDQATDLGPWNPLQLLPGISQDDLDTLALARLEGDRFERARARSNMPKRTISKLTAAGYDEWQAGIRSILRAPGSWAAEPDLHEGVLKVRAPVSREGLAEVAARFGALGDGLRKSVELEEYPVSGTARSLRVVYRIEALRDGEPIILEAVHETDTTTKAKTPDGIARAIGPCLSAAGIRDHAEQVEIARRVTEREASYPLEREEDEAGRLIPEDLEELAINDSCEHRKGTWVAMGGHDRAGLRLSCPSCGREQAKVLPPHRISKDAKDLPPGTGADAFQLQLDIARYLEKEEAYALLLGHEIPQGGLTVKDLIARDGQVSDIGFDRTPPAPKPKPTSVRAAMSRR